MRVMGLNLVAVLVATLAFYVIGMAIYGFIFMEAWGQQMLINHGVPEADAMALKGEALFARLDELPGSFDPAMAYGLGFLISLVTVIGIASVQKMSRPASIGAAVTTGLVLWFCFAGTTLAYNVVYSSESQVIFGIDLLHLALAYVAASAVHFAMDAKALRPA